jgi:hypothetical protein
MPARSAPATAKLAASAARPQPGPADQDAAQRRAPDLAAVKADAVHGVGLRQMVGGHSLGQQARRRGKVEALPDPARCGQRYQFPDLGMAGQH